MDVPWGKEIINNVSPFLYNADLLDILHMVLHVGGLLYPCDHGTLHARLRGEVVEVQAPRPRLHTPRTPLGSTPL